MPVYVLFAVLTVGLGYTFWRASYEKREREAGRPKRAEPWEVVDIEFYPDGVVVKVYLVHNAYEAQVLWNGNFIGKAGGFSDVQMAKAWGRAFARNKGADV